MKKYDFETIFDRKKTNSVKWDVKDGELPMWVADMDFKTAPEIIEAIKKRRILVFLDMKSQKTIIFQLFLRGIQKNTEYQSILIG